MDSIVRVGEGLRDYESLITVFDDGSGRYITSYEGERILRERNGDIIKWWTGGYGCPLDKSKDGRYIIVQTHYTIRVLDIVKLEFIFSWTFRDAFCIYHTKFGPDGFIISYFEGALLLFDYLGSKTMKEHKTHGKVTAFASSITKCIFSTFFRNVSTIYSLDTFAILFSIKGYIEWIKFANPSVILFECHNDGVYTLDLITRQIHRREIETFERFVNPSSDGKKLLVMTRNAPYTIITVTPMFPDTESEDCLPFAGCALTATVGGLEVEVESNVIRFIHRQYPSSTYNSIRKDNVIYHLFENFAPRPVYTRYTCGWNWVRIMSNGAVETNTGTVAHISEPPEDVGRKVEEALGSKEMALRLAAAANSEFDTIAAYNKAFEEYLCRLTRALAREILNH